MKIELSKPARTEKPTAHNETPKTNFQTLFNPAEKINTPPQARFAKILEESRNENTTRKNSDLERKADNSKESSAADEINKEEETTEARQEKDKVEEKNERHGEGDEQSEEQDESSTFAPMNFYAQTKPVSETSVPTARAILHVVDLERIVSMVRAQNLKNAEQVVISLKHSVLEGLQIKLTIDENSNLKAEFLAASEHIKNHLNTRKEELKSILRERGIKLSDLEVRQGSHFNGAEIQAQNELAGSKNSDNGSVLEITDADDSDDQTSYRV